MAVVASSLGDPDKVKMLEEYSIRQIRRHLENYVFDTARFLAERLVAQNRSEENMYWLAVCFRRSGHLNQAIAVLHGARRDENRYLLANCCFEQQKYADAERSLTGGELLSFEDVMGSKVPVPNGAAGYYLLGRVYRQQAKTKLAASSFVKSLELDPSLWSSYKELCEIGAKREASTFFGNATIFLSEEPISETGTPNNQTPDTVPAPRSSPRTSGRKGDRDKKDAGGESSVPNYLRPTSASMVKEPPRLKKPRLGAATSAPGSSTDRRRTARSDDMKATSTIIKKGVSSETVQKRSAKGEQMLLSILNSFGYIYLHVTNYECDTALNLLQLLPTCQRQSGWAQHQAGRMHLEKADFHAALNVFQTMHHREPHHLDGLELYSTTLWQLRREVDLSYLAQELTDFDKLSPEAWCAAGNCFSLQREHSMALTFFERAIQLDPSFTYAYTLSGHEYAANEDFEKAIKCYRHALRTDPRHYNAWSGLGTVYLNQERYELAEYHFRRAVQLHPGSSLAHCFLGMALHANKKFDDSLKELELAIRIQPKNTQAGLQRANVLINRERFEEAMEQLRSLLQITTKEATVYYLMGKVAKRLGNPQDALHWFTTALYYNPQDKNLIRTAIDKIAELDDEKDHDHDLNVQLPRL